MTANRNLTQVRNLIHHLLKIKSPFSFRQQQYLKFTLLPNPGFKFDFWIGILVLRKWRC